MKKYLFIFVYLLFASLTYAQDWQSGTNLGGAGPKVYSIWNSVSGNAIELSPEYGFLFGDKANNNFVRANTDCVCAEIKQNTGYSLYIMPSLSRNTQWLIQSKDITVAGLEDIPTMVGKTASGLTGVLEYIFTIPSGFTLSWVQIKNPTQGVVAGSDVSGTNLIVYLSSVTPGTNNLNFNVLLK